MKSTIRFGLLTVICALGAFTSIASADDRDSFRQRVYDRARDNAQANHRDRSHDRRDSRRDYSHDRGRHDYHRHSDHRRDDRRHFDRGHDRRHYDRSRDRHYSFDRRHDHRRYDSHRSVSYVDRFDRRYHSSLKRGFYCDDFKHFRGRHYHVSRTDFYSSFYPRYPYRPFSDRGGSLSVIVSIPF